MWVGKEGRGKGLTQYLPRSDDGHIIFTTCDRKTVVKLAHQHIVDVGEADKKMGVELLRVYLVQEQLVDDYREATKLLKELAFLLLAVVKAAAYINENRITFADYLALLADQEQDVIELLSEDFEDEARCSKVKNPRSGSLVDI